MRRHRLPSRRPSPEPIAAASESLWNIRELAHFIKRTPLAVYKMVERRQIPYIKLGQSVRFDPRAIESWIRRNAVQAAPSPWPLR